MEEKETERSRRMNINNINIITPNGEQPGLQGD
jgi:hypothetical protein